MEENGNQNSSKYTHQIDTVPYMFSSHHFPFLFRMRKKTQEILLQDTLIHGELKHHAALMTCAFNLILPWCLHPTPPFPSRRNFFLNKKKRQDQAIATYPQLVSAPHT